MKKIFIITLIITSFMYETRAQDIHFSQYNNTPMLVSPALTAEGPGDHRVGLIHRQQWEAFTNGYITTGAYYDGKFLKKRAQNTFLGVGLMFDSDKAGDSQMGTTRFGISSAYHMELTDGHTFALGFQGLYGQNSINYSNLTWDSQYDGDKYDDNIDSGENLYGEESINYFDVSTGLSWSYVNSRYFNSILSVSLQHVNSIKVNFNNIEEELSRKITVYGKANYMLKSTVLTFSPSFLYQHQGLYNELVYGLNLKMQINEANQSSKFLDDYFGIGLYHRLGDAVILNLSLGYRNFEISIGYDINMSDLSNASKYKGAVELSLTYYTPFNSRRRRGSSLL